ncbi:fibrous sheath CABYR-binding protein-like [Daphnia magna]|uniref:fibrous sheath CABYR-binding protein-like n=1 Tax=Daphnia magna TaxID=35525 RepID=UPI001E1BA3B1|nr:fibrous sheath CABYR-binding protein-like [Daphnia magna]
MNSPIRKLPGAKKQFAHVQSKVDCKRPAIPSAEAAKPVRESPKLKTKSPVVTGASSFKSPPVQELAKPFRAKPVPPSQYGQPFRPVLRRKSPLPNNEAPKVMEVPTAKAVEAATSQDAVEEVPEVDVAVKVPFEVPVEAAENAADVVADQVEEVLAVDEVVEVAPAAEAEAVEEDAAHVIEELPVAEEAVEAADEDEAAPPVVALAAEALLPSEVVSGPEKKKTSSAPGVPSGPEASPVQVEPHVVDEACFAQLTRKQKRNIATKQRRSASRRAKREALRPDAHIYIPPRLLEAPEVDVAVQVPVEADVVADQVEEVPAVDEVVEVAPAAEAEAVEEDAAQVIEELPVAAEAVEAADEDEAAPPVVALAAEALLPSEVVSGPEKKKTSSAPGVPSAPEASPLQVEPHVVDEACFAQLTRKQKRNIATKQRRSASRRAKREALRPDAPIYIPPRLLGAPEVPADYAPAVEAHYMDAGYDAGTAYYPYTDPTEYYAAAAGTEHYAQDSGYYTESAPVYDGQQQYVAGSYVYVTDVPVYSNEYATAVPVNYYANLAAGTATFSPFSAANVQYVA